MRIKGVEETGATQRQEPELLKLWGRIERQIVERLAVKEKNRGKLMGGRN